MQLRNTIIFLVTALTIAGCAGPLKINYSPGNRQDYSGIKAAHLNVLLKPYADLRGVDPRYIGKISSTVSDMNTDKIILDSKDVATFITEAMKLHLEAEGFNVIKARSGEEDPVDVALIISGEVRKFRFDVGVKDEIDIELVTTVTEKDTGKILWSGTVSEKNDRFAGVMGNSRLTIAAYISKTLRTVITKTVMKIDVNTVVMQLPVNREVKDNDIREGFGRLVVNTEPPRAQVYIGEVYYGLSPLTVDIAHGVLDATINLKGFKVIKEKISVRSGDVTEMNRSLEREEY